MLPDIDVQLRQVATESMAAWLRAANGFLSGRAVPRRVGARRWFRHEHIYSNEDVLLGSWELADLQLTLALPEWQTVVASLMASDWVRSQFENGGIAFDNTWRPLSLESIPFMVFRPVILDNEGALPEITDKIRDGASAFVYWVFARHVIATVLQPVFGLTGTLDVNIADGIELRRADENTIIQLLDWDVLPPTFATQMVWENTVPDYVIEFSLAHDKRLQQPAAPNAGVHVDLARREAVSGAFSLLSAGRVEIDGAFVGYKPLDVLGAGLQPASTHMYRIPREVDVDTMRNDLPQVYEAICPVDLRKGKGLALRRLGQAASRNYQEDRILDLMIAAEAVFLPGERLELAFKLALRCGYYLEPNDRSKRERIFTVIKKAYDTRGAVAHGEAVREHVPVGNVQLAMSDFLNEVEFIMRRALRKMFEQDATIDFNSLVLGPIDQET